MKSMSQACMYMYQSLKNRTRLCNVYLATFMRLVVNNNHTYNHTNTSLS